MKFDEIIKNLYRIGIEIDSIEEKLKGNTDMLKNGQSSTDYVIENNVYINLKILKSNYIQLIHIFINLEMENRKA